MTARERYERFSKRSKIDRLHWGAVEAGIPCAVPMDIACEYCHVGAVRVSERDINGYTGVRVPEELKTLRPNLIAQMSSSAAGGRSTLSRAVVLAPVLRPSAALVVAVCVLRHHFRNVPHQDIPRLPRTVVRRKSFPTNTKMIRTLGPDLTINNSLDDPLSCHPVCLAVGVEAAGRRRGSGPPDSVDRLEAVERLQTADFAALRQELALLKAQIAQVSQTASNVQGDLGAKLAVLRTRVGALEQASAPSHQD
ncbi:unnamed protein product [Phytophthora fragariaefolia]|uniref:Unnamed protein product n=1 Tax=Phytophthora fragariaefolia TaxID=1490495 RepID=A0A9W7CRW2_9STRA|nr:unnamed protein product [Phytophthora fragariaefolia]